VFGLKPTLGLLAQDGIIPIGHSQDTAGPMARTVADIAILLAAMQSPFGPVIGHTLPADYATFLDANSLAGKVIGVDQRYLTPDYFGQSDIIAVFNEGLNAIVALGGTLVAVDSGDIYAYGGDEFTVLLDEFKVHVAQYLAGLTGTSMHTLSDLIAFNIAHCPAEMPYYGQELFEISDATSGDLTDPAYLAARANCLLLSRTLGIDSVLNGGVDAIVAPSYSFASTPAAVAGYPNIAIPVGLTPEGKPAGMWMYAGFLQEPKLLAFAYALEQVLNPRTAPQFLGALQPFPPDPGICASLPKKPHVFTGKAHLPHGRLFL
jgi:amidase